LDGPVGPAPGQHARPATAGLIGVDAPLHEGLELILDPVSDDEHEHVHGREGSRSGCDMKLRYKAARMAQRDERLAPATRNYVIFGLVFVGAIGLAIRDWTDPRERRGESDSPLRLLLVSTDADGPASTL